MPNNQMIHHFLSDHIHERLLVAEERWACRTMIAGGENENLSEGEEPVEDKGNPQVSLFLEGGAVISGVVDQVYKDFVDIIEGEDVDPSASGDISVLSLAASTVVGVRISMNTETVY